MKIKKMVAGVMTEVDVTEAEYAEELVGQVKTASAEGVKSVSDAVKTLAETVNQKFAENEARLKKIEDLPLNPAAPVAPQVIIPKMYKGVNLHSQGEALRMKFRDARDIYKTLSQDAHFEDYSKFLIDVAKAIVFKDPEAIADLHAAKKKSIDAIQDIHVKTGLEEATGSLGGYLVPVQYQPELIKLARDMSWALQRCRVVPMGAPSVKYPSEASLVSMYWVGEKTAPTKSDPSFGQVTLTAKKLMGVTNPIANELFQDSMVDIVGLLTEQFAYAYGLEMDNQALNGTGDPCSGILVNAGYSVIMANDAFSAVSADNLSEMITKISDMDQAGAVWLFNKLITHYFRTLKDDNGGYIFQRPQDGRSGSIWEIPYIQTVKGPSTSAADTAFLALANLQQFYIGILYGAMTLDADPFYKFAEDETRFRMKFRVALQMARNTAFVKLKTAANG